MKRCLFLAIIFYSKAYGQINKDYFVITNKDTLTITLTETELQESKKSRVVELRHTIKHRKKKLQEKISCDLKIKRNDTIFWCGIVDYFDTYLIALTGTLSYKAKNSYTVEPLEFRRINYLDIEWIKTDGKRNIWPQFWFSGLVLTVGSVLTAYSLRESFKEHGDSIAPFLIPVGICILYIGGKLFGDTITFEYYLPDWSIRVIDLEKRNKD